MGWFCFPSLEEAPYRFHSGCTSSPSPRQCPRVLFPLRPCHFLSFRVFLIAVLRDASWYLLGLCFRRRVMFGTFPCTCELSVCVSSLYRSSQQQGGFMEARGPRAWAGGPPACQGRGGGASSDLLGVQVVGVATHPLQSFLCPPRLETRPVR